MSNRSIMKNSEKTCYKTLMQKEQLTPLVLVPNSEGNAATILGIHICGFLTKVFINAFPLITSQGVNPLDLWLYILNRSGTFDPPYDTARLILYSMPLAERIFIYGELAHMGERFEIERNAWGNSDEDDEDYEDDDDDFEYEEYIDDDND